MDLLMRHQNDKLDQKYHAMQSNTSPRKSAASPSPQSTNSRSGDKDSPYAASDRLKIHRVSNIGLQVDSITPAIIQPSSDVAIAFFVFNFNGGVYLDYLPRLYGAADRSSLLEASFEAVAISYFSSRRRCPSLMRQAMERYSIALRETNHAVSTPKKAAQDDTVASVMLLALFTALSCDAAEALPVWSKHVSAAMELMLLRVSRDSSSDTDQHLLSHIVSSVYLDCYAQRKALPLSLSLLRRRSLLSTQFQLQFWTVTDTLAGLRQDAIEGRLEDLDVLKQALILHRQARSLLEHLTRTHDIIAHAQGHIRISCDYETHRRIQARNTLLMILMDLNELLCVHGRRYVSMSPEYHALDRMWMETQANRATKAYGEVVEEIYESIPPFLKKGQRQATPGTNTDMWICSFLWPFSKALESQGVLATDLTDRIRRQLEHFAEVCDNRQLSKVIVQLSESGTAPAHFHALYLC
ncbi:hypothetical protein PV05_09276 [Exophiala xenobiotica]|uniref:Uncharacterized protein n=1 Tax=Exophiala xenobiotica TaxID=348802 RepID=A0A0D2EGE3_9EURO|nr:uncharacterized protein PV05_09276 [Exophiala xenobiotica]KIW53730.1 hypothetical protein PV05_09276 [Exophiala xenobiotica]